MVRRANRRDDNHVQLVADARSIPGVSVADTADLGNGFPDIVIGYRGVNIMCEIKDGDKPPSKQQLTPAEQKFHDEWNGRVFIVTCFSDILDLLHAASRGTI